MKLKTFNGFAFDEIQRTIVTLLIMFFYKRCLKNIHIIQLWFLKSLIENL